MLKINFEILNIGPRNWPIVGSIPAMIAQPGDTPFDVMERQRKMFGNIVGLFLGGLPTILISGMEDVREISAKEEFIYRPQITYSQHRYLGYKTPGKLSIKKFLNKNKNILCFLGVFFSEGDMWKNQRRFTLRHLRDFGFGKQKMDEYIHEEVIILFNAIDSIAKQQSDHREIGLDLLMIMPAVAINTLWYILAGAKHDLDDEKFIHLTKLVLQFFRMGDQTSPVLVYKFLQKIPIINKKYKQQRACGDELNKFVQVK